MSNLFLRFPGLGSFTTEAGKSHPIESAPLRRTRWGDLSIILLSAAYLFKAHVITDRFHAFDLAGECNGLFDIGLGGDKTAQLHFAFECFNVDFC